MAIARNIQGVGLPQSPLKKEESVVNRMNTYISQQGILSDLNKIDTWLHIDIFVFLTDLLDKIEFHFSGMITYSQDTVIVAVFVYIF